MEEKNIDEKYIIFDDRELDDEEYIDEKDLKLLISDEESQKIDKEIQDILDNMIIEYED